MNPGSPNVRAFLPILLIALLASCQESRSLSNGFRRVDCLVREDPGAGELTEVQSAPDWKPCAPRGMDSRFSGSTYWFRLRDPIEMQPLLIVLEWKVLWEVDMFRVSAKGETQRMQTGIRRVRSTWPMQIGDYPAFPIEARQGDTWYLRLYSGGVRLGFPISVLTREEFERRVELESAIEFGYAGILLPIVALAFLFAIGLRERVYAYYGLYLFFLWLNRNANYGNAFRLLYPDWPWVAEHIVLLTLGCTYVCSLLFFRKFTRLRELMPQADRVAIVLQYVAFLLIPLALTSAPRYLLARTYIFLYVVSILAFLFVIFFLVFRHNQKSLWLFAAGWTIFYLAAVPHILYLLGILSYSVPAAYGPALILPLEALLFAGSLFQRYRTILHEKEGLARQNAEILARMESFRHAGSRYARSRLAGIDVDAMLLRLNQIMEGEKVFREEGLTLGALAAQLGISTHEFSELLNSRLGLSFPQLLLNYRVGEAERLMKAHPEKTLIEVAFESGFNSKTAFNVGFKKLRGIAPSTMIREARSHFPGEENTAGTAAPIKGD
ncbi:MAG: helix-turn-helix domain-containing protein [Spirochaetia bacterium]|nr:helix-turn-helix domain-containing protein [Spirochaetia bacterium]